MLVNAGLIQELVHQLLADLRLLDGLRHQILEVDHIRPVVPQAVGKGVVLRLGDLQIGDVVKEKPFQILRHQVLQLPARVVEHDLPQAADLGGVVQPGFQAQLSWHRASLLFWL